MKRRQFIQNFSLGASSLLLPVSSLKSSWTFMFDKPDSDFNGVKIGAISYSFRSMPSSADDILGYLVDAGVSYVELMGDPIEQFAGAPESLPWRRGELTDAELKERETRAQEITQWRLSAPMDKFKELKKKYDSQGVTIDIVKFPLDRMSEEEIAYCFNVAKLTGARGITLERSDEAVKKLAPFADKYKTKIGYHNHTEVDYHSWDKALEYSKYNAINLDVGHFVAGTNQSPIPFMKEHHDRILSLHLKDRKKNEGDNVPWGQGDTPIKDILQLMRLEKYKFMAAIELEYPIPEGSDAVKEVKKCVEYCKEALV